MSAYSSLVVILMTAALVSSAAAAPPGRGGRGNGASCGGCGRNAPNTARAGGRGALNADESATLTNMRREEQLAHDTYVTLGKQFDLRPFQNIPQAELHHREAVIALMNRHGVADPMAGMSEGRFDVPEMQALYDRLVLAGSKDAVSALKAGAEVEELDIADLRRATAETSRPDLRRVYRHLEQASMHHLRAFVRNIERRGGAYMPEHLTQAEYDKIIRTADDAGPRAGMGRARANNTTQPSGQGRGRNGTRRGGR